MRASHLSKAIRDGQPVSKAAGLVLRNMLLTALSRGYTIDDPRMLTVINEAATLWEAVGRRLAERGEPQARLFERTTPKHRSAPGILARMIDHAFNCSKFNDRI